MIEDFDGPDPTPNRRGRQIVLSVLIVVGMAVSYAAVSSPEFRGPYATPRPLPSAVQAPLFTPAPVAIDPATLRGPAVTCVLPQSVRVPPAFVGDVTYVYDRFGQTVIATLLTSVSTPCPVFWGWPPRPMPYDRVAR